jgi:hypothetical protein
MNYSEHRNNIKSGDVLAWSHRGWRSLYDIKIQIVRLATRSEYSHVGIAWVVGGRVFVIEAVEPRARIFPLSKLGNFYHVPMGANWDGRVEEAAISYVGAEYRQLHAIKAFFKPLRVVEVARQYGVLLGTRSTPDAVVLAAQELGNPLYYIKSET